LARRAKGDIRADPLQRLVAGSGGIGFNCLKVNPIILSAREITYRITLCGIQKTIARSKHEYVGTTSSGKGICTAPTGEYIIASAPTQGIIAATAAEIIAIPSSVQPVAPALAL